jgi:hypothetical protein
MPRTSPPESKTNHRRLLLRVVVVVTLLALLILLGPILLLAVAFWVPASTLGAIFPEEELRLHLVHGVGVSLVLWTVLIGVGLQWRRPKRWISTLWVPAVYIAGGSSLAVLAGVFEAIYWLPFLLLVGLALAMHPKRTASVRPAHRPTALLAAVVSIPLVTYSYDELLLQFGSITNDPHVAGAHYATMSMLSIIIVIGAWLGSTEVPGRRVTAFIAGGSTVLLGIASLLNPDQVSAFTPFWSIAAMIWGAIYLVVANRIEAITCPVR